MKSLTPLTSDRVFTKSEYDSMDNDQKRYAQEQLRVIFCRQMAKVSANMSRRKQVQHRIATQTDLQQEQHQNRMDQLNRKMASVEFKRKQQLRRRIETCKLHDESWRSRMKQIDWQTKIQYKDATIKLQKYQEDYEQYLRNRKFHTQPSASVKQPAENKQRSRVDSHRIHMNENVTVQATRSRMSIRALKKIKLIARSQQDSIIKDHQEKCKKLSDDKQNEIFQRALEKLEHISHIKHDILKKVRQGSPNQHSYLTTKRNRKRSPQLNDESPEHLNQNHYRRHEKAQNNWDKYINQKRLSHNATDNRLLVRQKRQQQESQRRWQAFQNSQKKGKKQHILRVIKEKVAEYKTLAQRF